MIATNFRYLFSCFVCFLWLVSTGAGNLQAQKNKRSFESQFHFPNYLAKDQIDCRITLVNGKRPSASNATMSVDGVPTKVPWANTRSSMQVFQLNERIFLLNDYKGFATFVWDRQEHVLTPIEHLNFGYKTKYGYMAFQDIVKDGRTVAKKLVDFEPITGERRVLYKGQILRAPVGYWKNGIVIQTAVDEVSLIRPGQPAELVTCDLKGFAFCGSGDAIRDDWVLLVRVPAMVGREIHKPVSYQAKVAMLNLKTGEFKDVGEFAGGYSCSTAVPHPRSDARWIDAEEAKKRRSDRLKAIGSNGREAKPEKEFSALNLFGGSIALVEEESHQLFK